MSKKIKTITMKRATTPTIGAVMYMDCPHCKKMILMGEPKFSKALTEWAKQNKK